MNNSLKPKRLLLGKRLSTRKLEGELLPKTIALPIFSSDPLSSVAYGPQELLMILTLGGVSFLSFAPGIAAVIENLPLIERHDAHLALAELVRLGRADARGGVWQVVTGKGRKP